MLTRILVAALFLLSAFPLPVSAQPRTPEQYMAIIEGPQEEPGDNELGSLTLLELMERFNVPGVSVAVIHDFRIHWAKGYGIADVETGAPVDTETVFRPKQ